MLVDESFHEFKRNLWPTVTKETYQYKIIVKILGIINFWPKYTTDKKFAVAKWVNVFLNNLFLCCNGNSQINHRHLLRGITDI
jgi:hypothetical protein